MSLLQKSKIKRLLYYTTLSIILSRSWTLKFGPNPKILLFRAIFKSVFTPKCWFFLMMWSLLWSELILIISWSICSRSNTYIIITIMLLLLWLSLLSGSSLNLETVELKGATYLLFFINRKLLGAPPCIDDLPNPESLW